MLILILILALAFILGLVIILFSLLDLVSSKDILFIVKVRILTMISTEENVITRKPDICFLIPFSIGLV